MTRVPSRLQECVLIFAFLLSPGILGQFMVQEWVARSSGPGSSADEANAIAVDSAGNAYVTGSLGTIKYDPEGAVQWKDFGVGCGWAIALDGSGNVYVAGQFQNFATIKYLPDGTRLWLNPHDGGDWAYALALDASGNVYVTGFGKLGGSDYDYITVKYDPNNGEEKWAMSCKGPGNGNDEAIAIAVDSGGNVYVTGESTGIGIYTDYLTIKYDANNGNELWPSPIRYDGPQNGTDVGWAIALDQNGNVFVTGYSDGNDTGYSGYDYTTIKYSPEGVELWPAPVRHNGTANANDEPKSIVVDGNGDVYVTGSSDNLSRGHDITTIKYVGEDGHVLWESPYNGPGNGGDVGVAMVFDSSGNLFVTGSSTGIGTEEDFTTIQYDSGSGKELWLARYNGPGNGWDRAKAIGIDAQGNVYVTGLSFGDGTERDYATIKYSKPAELVAGVPSTVKLTEADPIRPDKYYRLGAQAGKAVVLTVDDPDPEDSNALYLRWGALPSIAEFDLADSVPGRSSRRLVIPGERNEECYILVRAQTIHGGSNDVTVLAEVEDLALEGMTITRAPEGTDRLGAEIRGGGFDGSTAFSLIQINGPGVILPLPGETTILSSRSAEVVFDLTAAPPGSYDLKAEGAGGLTATLGQAVFEIQETPAPLGPRLEARLGGINLCGYRLHMAYTLLYRNPGDQEMTAPLFKIAVSGGGEHRLCLDREGEPRPGDLLALGIEPEGIAGRLAPGTKEKILPIILWSDCMNCEVQLRASVFKPAGDETIHWDEISAPQGMTAEDWEIARPGLAARFGSTWSEYHEALARLATRLSRRGIYAASVLELFRFAVRDALGRPSSAVVGSLVDRDTKVPQSGKQVLALEEGAVKSSIMTDREGNFALDWLRGGRTYRIAVVDQDVGLVEKTLPVDGDILDLRLEGTPLANGLSPDCPDCDESGLPEEPLVPPSRHFEGMPILPLDLQVVSSLDPNEKIGPGDGGIEGLVSIYQPIEYLVTFENDPEKATAPAWRVEIEDQPLDMTKIDRIAFGAVAIGGEYWIEREVGKDLTSGYGRYPCSDSLGCTSYLKLKDANPEEKLLRVQRWIDPGTGRPKVVLEAVDPRTEKVLVGADGYFLPLNDADKRGEGYATFLLWAKDGLQEDDILENRAAIRFDNIDQITAPKPPTTVRHRVSYVLEVLRDPVPESGGGRAVRTDVELRWGSGEIREGITCDIYLWEEGGERREAPVAAGLTVCRYSPQGLRPGKAYRWQVLAKKNPHNSRPGEEWTFRTEPFFRRGDVNGDGVMDISDGISDLEFLFLGGKEPSCLKTLDANDDGEKDLSDPVFLLAHLFLGGPAPAEPFAACGYDPIPDTLPCDSHPPCN